MTHSENKPSYSENCATTLEDIYPDKLTAINFSIQYTILDQVKTTIIDSPFDGFLNILYPETIDSCINSYVLNEYSYIIRRGENIIHAVTRGDKLKWKNINDQNIGIAIYIPNHVVEDFKEKFVGLSQRFKNGLLTKSDSRIILICKQIITLHKNADSLYQLRIQSLLIDAIVHQIESLFVENDKQEIIVNKSHYDKIILAKEFIHKDLAKNYTIAELSKLVGTNEQYLKKYFKQHFGKTVMNYITDQKMNYAKGLIMSGEYRVSDVARLTGYKHSTHFTTAFKKYFGFIPNSLRYTFLLASVGTQQILAEVENLINIV
ncbi:helix-turn-helix domain-containing protein [Sphingobacterium rhinopitheci]|uniref:helix-turn-helix domain-containing protein n=1 Tax=Sphingobacterium rhinopitheci TaxID=2781960 RepID=UPI001F52902D|nr:AraC family transcriptional regulator [Sphingobacterium rhinopitheci]MCI0920673.1 helix-turn-helix transcriptional regulator [Sphingobacterium rhinopitheci]